MTAATIDLAQFRTVFFDEAAEQLEQMETLLVRLDPAQASDEDLNAIFRAAHSIKGGAGTFGFTEMAEVTHTLESLLDRARKRTLGLDGGLVDSLLGARDLLVQLLGAYRDGGAPDRPRIAAVTQDLAAAGARADSPGVAPQAPTAAGTTQRLLVEVWQPAGGDLATGPDDLAAALQDFGAVTRTDDGPPRDGAPGTALRYWVETPADDATVVGDLAFIVPQEHVRIVGRAPASVAGPPACAAASRDPGFGFFTGSPGAPDEGPGYGFFDDAPGAPPAAAPPPPLRDDGHAPAPGAVSAALAGNGADTSIRVGVEKVDQLINLVGELVITQAMLVQTAGAIDPLAHARLHEGIAQLSRNTRSLQDAVMSVRMMPMAVVFNRFPRVVRDLAHKLGKDVELATEGEATELDKGLVEKVVDPLTHLVRNSLDHGIEPPEVRVAAGKPARGTIALRAYHRGGNIVIEVSDDGAGLHRARILAKARERGLPVDDAMPDAEVWPLIFEAGLTTAEKVTDVSGRGVGMDVVRRNIAALGGRVDIDSQAGIGTRIAIRLPLTLAILDGMSVRAGRETFILPLANVVESVQVAGARVHPVAGEGRVLDVRGAFLPIVALRTTMGMRREPGDEGVYVIVESDGTQAALAVDELLGQHQVVIKSLETNFRRVAGVSGATIMGDGRVALILDAPALVRGAARVPRAAPPLVPGPNPDRPDSP